MFTLQIEGERIKKADFAPGMSHRGVEWMGMRRNCIQVVYLAERICGICGITHSISFVRAVEQIAQIQVPNRAHYIRSIVGELERIHSHLLWAGVAAMNSASIPPSTSPGASAKTSWTCWNTSPATASTTP